MSTKYHSFIEQILALIPKEKLDIPYEQYQISHIWTYWSAKSDLIPSVTFTKMNETNENRPMVRIEFSHEGIAGIDY